MTAAVVHEPPAWRRWSGRLAWFAAGAIAYALATASPEEQASPASNVIAHADRSPDPQVEASLAARSSEPAPPDDPVPEREEHDEAIAAEAIPPVADADSDPLEPAPLEATPTEAAPTEATPTEATPPTSNAPSLPLPRMPGTRRLRSTATPAEDGRGWVLVHALQVPAKPEQVETFYRKALADQGLRVAGSRTPAQPGRVFLRGRGRRAHADVSIDGRGSRARTSVQVIWRAFR